MDINTFITWDMLADFGTLIGIVFIFTEFTKELNIFKKIHTKYYSMIVSFMLILLTNVQYNTFKLSDIVLYLISSIVISMGANGIYEFNK